MGGPSSITWASRSHHLSELAPCAHSGNVRRLGPETAQGAACQRGRVACAGRAGRWQDSPGL
eukprot:6308394-Alexandrium_andersonii.AAC.1